MKEFDKKAVNFIILIGTAILLLLFDLTLWWNNNPTFSETVWDLNQHTIAIAFGTGLVCGHLFTVPKD